MEDDVPSWLWVRPAMRDALARRDISKVYRALLANGYSQCWIAMRTGQVQSDVSEIVGGRQVRGYDLLVRIADGLGVPRGAMGLSSSSAQYRPPTDEEEEMRRRAFLGLVSSVALGDAVTDEQRQQFLPTMDLEVEPFTATVRASDAQALTAMVDAFHSTDQRFGGYGQYRAALAAVRYGESLVDGADDRARRALLSGTAYCHASAGWFAMEESHPDVARRHYAKALELSRHSRDPLMRAFVLYRAGRNELHFGDAQHALKLFQLGRAVTPSHSPLMMSVLLANSAWASAVIGCAEHSYRLVEQAREVHDSVDFSRDIPTFRWFRTPDLASLAGAVHVARRDYESAVENLEIAVVHRPRTQHRSQVFDGSGLAHAYLALGDRARAVSVGQEVLEHAKCVRSARLSDRLTPLLAEAQSQAEYDSDVWQLSRELSKQVETARVPT